MRRRAASEPFRRPWTACFPGARQPSSTSQPVLFDRQGHEIGRLAEAGAWQQPSPLPGRAAAGDRAGGDREHRPGHLDDRHRTERGHAHDARPGGQHEPDLVSGRNATGLQLHPQGSHGRPLHRAGRPAGQRGASSGERRLEDPRNVGAGRPLSHRQRQHPSKPAGPLAASSRGGSKAGSISGDTLQRK